jgi:hypothetical protein
MRLFFKKKEELKPTPEEEMYCKCGFPLPPAPLRIREFPYKRVIVEHTYECPICNKENKYNG